MSDSEEDYMSFEVQVDSKDDIRPSLVFNKEKRKLDLFKKNQESSKKRQKSLYELERENRDKGLKTAISTENKGFKLLEKMGFKPGGALGKSRNGIKEPIDIVYKEGTSGVGTDSHLRELVSKRHQQKIKNLELCETQFRHAKKERKNLAQIRKDFFKAQKICEELDFRSSINDPVQDFFWTKETMKRRRKLERNDNDDSDSSDEEESELNVTEENLCTIIDYLRSKHLYCLFCAITGTNIDDLKENCPGPYRIDHDDEL